MRDGGTPYTIEYNIRIHQQYMIPERLVSRMANSLCLQEAQILLIAMLFLCYAEIPVFPTNSK